MQNILFFAGRSVSQINWLASFQCVDVGKMPQEILESKIECQLWKSCMA